MQSTLLRLRRSRRLRKYVKTAFDYALTVPALILLAPLMLIIALLIVLESPGPVFYKRRVLGLNGREFYAFQFRTMYVNGDELLIRNRQQWVALLRQGQKANDPRVTRIGRFLRRSGLVELPRLFNVLNRDMSLVGPHMITRKEVMRFGRRRMETLTSVLPGLTGLWQLNGRAMPPTERIKLEQEYIENWSLWLDVKIIFGTFAAVWKEQSI